MIKLLLILLFIVELYAADKIVMLGDSITYRTNWQMMLKNYNIQNMGINGDTVKDILNRSDDVQPDAKKVFIMAGINDIAKGYSVKSIFAIYKQLVKKLQKKGLKVYIQSTLYTGDRIDPSYNKKVKRLNALLRKYARENDIRFIDLNRYLSRKGSLKRKYTNDEVHLNRYGYSLWVNVIKNYIK
jgi:lysophospholipase L1-like esterase